MKIKYYSCIFWLSTIINPLSVQAEVILDGSLGRQGSLMGPQFDIHAELGQQVGSNLFHSFDTFNLQKGEIATFSGPTQIDNVISRVTGGHNSFINGTLSSKIPQANLYFINPAGITVGEQAKLDVTGSVHLSTADTLKLSEKGQFAATHPQTSVLTSATPTAFGFLTDMPAAITMRDSQLSVKDAQTLSLIGGEISLERSELKAAEGRLNLASVDSQGEVVLTPTGINTDNIRQYHHFVVKKSSLDVSGEGAGSIYIRAGQFEVEESTLLAKPQGGKDGKIIDIVVDNLVMSNSDIINSTAGSGKSGKIIIEAKDSIALSGIGYGVFSNALSQEVDAGNAGEIEIITRKLHFVGGAQITSATFGTGQSGTIKIDVTEDLVLSDGIIGTSSQSEVAKAGDAGEIIIKAKNLLLSQGAQIGNATFGEGQGGTIAVDVIDTALFDGYLIFDNFYFPTGISATTERTEGLAGKAGDIQLNAKHLKITGGAAISGVTYGPGKGGEIAVNVSDSIAISDAVKVLLNGEEKIKNSAITSASEPLSNVSGDAGEINIKTLVLTLSKGGKISTATTQGGKAGEITINANQLSLDNQSTITSESLHAGDAGNITLNVDKNLSIKNARVSTQATKAAGGNIIVKIPRLLYLHRGAITTSVRGGKGGGGDITIELPNFVVLDKSRIVAQAVGGDGGNITIKSDQFIASPDSLVDASSQKGIDGDIIISAPDVDLSGKLVILSTDFLNATKQLRAQCKAQSLEELSSFVVVNLKGATHSPYDQKSSSLFNSKAKESAADKDDEKHTYQGIINLTMKCNEVG